MSAMSTSPTDSKQFLTAARLRITIDSSMLALCLPWTCYCFWTGGWSCLHSTLAAASDSNTRAPAAAPNALTKPAHSTLTVTSAKRVHSASEPGHDGTNAHNPGKRMHVNDDRLQAPMPDGASPLPGRPFEPRRGGSKPEACVFCSALGPCWILDFDGNWTRARICKDCADLHKIPAIHMSRPCAHRVFDQWGRCIRACHTSCRGQPKTSPSANFCQRHQRLPLNSPNLSPYHKVVIKTTKGRGRGQEITLSNKCSTLTYGHYSTTTYLVDITGVATSQLLCLQCAVQLARPIILSDYPCSFRVFKDGRCVQACHFIARAVDANKKYSASKDKLCAMHHPFANPHDCDRGKALVALLGLIWCLVRRRGPVHGGS
ncbi:hypothetical protein BCR44DRAFT_403347 [Catenaria anguillulae PL171]|uniref:Uncharacterized protein n=1 Tax=Catenaria anguillulae PL171 TaxID=765915 RepID=A0A1Y2H7R0_9FUNG|nr:hypothetical protein BCR44DRAFT_403347 [Catenaria anguillulae PL171]